MDTVHDHIWDDVNAHLATKANSFPELVEQLGSCALGTVPRVCRYLLRFGSDPIRGRAVWL